jgi:ubiquitin carboxyl-terminal hydrolase 10
MEEDVVEEPMDVQTSEVSTIAAPSEPETPATSQAPSESDYTQVSPTTPAQAPVNSPKATPTQSKTQHVRRDTRTAVAVPVIPGLAKAKQSPTATKSQESATPQSEKSVGVIDERKSEAAETSSTTGEEAAPITLPPKQAPKSWADLVRSNVPPSAPGAPNGVAAVNGVSLPKSASLADALKQYGVQNDSRLSFLEPRGLVNTGNMCYMNSVSLAHRVKRKSVNNEQILQVLVFCTPFYNFLDQVRQRTVHSMKSATPLVDAMIMFMREFKVLASADSADVLRTVLNAAQLEQYGDPVIPQYVYDAIATLDRFNSMRVSQHLGRYTLGLKANEK